MVVRYINPDGQVVEVPEADATHFDAKGWERADAPKNDDNKPKKGKKTNNA